jgi:cytochrome c6
MMKKLVRASLAVIVVAGMTTIGSAAESLATNAVFKSHCAMCHGPNGEGKAALKTKPMKEAAAKSDAELTNIIENGIPGTSMKGYKGKLTEAQVKELVESIKAQK